MPKIKKFDEPKFIADLKSRSSETEYSKPYKYNKSQVASRAFIVNTGDIKPPIYSETMNGSEAKYACLLTSDSKGKEKIVYGVMISGLGGSLEKGVEAEFVSFRDLEQSQQISAGVCINQEQVMQRMMRINRLVAEFKQIIVPGSEVVAIKKGEAAKTARVEMDGQGIKYILGENAQHKLSAGKVAISKHGHDCSVLGSDRWADDIIGRFERALEVNIERLASVPPVTMPRVSATDLPPPIPPRVTRAPAVNTAATKPGTAPSPKESLAFVSNERYV